MRLPGLAFLAAAFVLTLPISAQIPPSTPAPATPSFFLLLDSSAWPITQPVVLTHPNPDFSQCTTLPHTPPRIVIKLEVDKKGLPQQVEVAQASQNKCVDKAVAAAVHNYRFTPAQHNGEPASTHIALAVKTGDLASHDEDSSASKSKNPMPSGTTPPVLLKNVEPQFPPNAPWGSASVQISLSVEPNGLPSNVHVISSSNLGDGYEEAAAAAVKRYRFWPAIQNGQPVKVDLYIDVNFEKTVR